MSSAADRLPGGGERRYWCRLEPDGETVVFDDDETRHLRTVMRRRAGERVEALDGSGRVLTVELETTRGRSVVGRLVGARTDDPAPGDAGPTAPGVGRGVETAPAVTELWLGQALIRPRRLEWLLEKAVEIGIAGFLPLVTRRAQPHAEHTAARRQRLERVARAAVAQSLGTRLPVLAEARPLEALRLDTYERVLVAHGPAACDPGVLAAVSGRVLVLVGPEGGFDPAELAALEAAGALRLGLGRRRLRAETAAVVALGLVRLLAGGPHR
jgi:16S rRNA (uracil1498-N3)-methyltransferase